MRALKSAVIIMGVLIVVGTATLAVLIIQKLGSIGATAARAPTVLDEPPGTHIAGMTAAGDRLAVQLQGGGTDRVVVIDLRSLAITGRIALAR
jgi:hypothetical protein